MSVNKVILVGWVGKEPEIITFDNGKLAKLSLATSEKYKNKKGEKVENTEWHNIVTYGSLVEVIEKYVKKGDLLYVEGKITTRTYEDKNGVKKYVTEIISSGMTMLGRGGNSGGEAKKEEKPKPKPPKNDDDEADDLPF